MRWSEASSVQEQQELRSARWRRSSQGLYVPAHVDRSSSQRVYEAHASLPDHGAIGGWAAAHWLGSPFMDGVSADGTILPVLLCVGPGTHRHRQPGIDVCRDRLPAVDIAIVGGLRCTTPLRTAFDLARRAPSETAAVIAIDTLLECGLIDDAVFRAYVEEHPGWRGVPRARVAAELCARGVRSPRETRLRLICRRAGLPPLLVNPSVFSVEGYLIGIPDLLCVESATVIEYDGEDHLDPAQNASDARRDARFRVHGLNTLRATRDDINGPRDELIDRIQRAYLDGVGRDLSCDRWTLETPPDWSPPNGERPAS